MTRKKKSQMTKWTFLCWRFYVFSALVCEAKPAHKTQEDKCKAISLSVTTTLADYWETRIRKVGLVGLMVVEKWLSAFCVCHGRYYVSRDSIPHTLFFVRTKRLAFFMSFGPQVTMFQKNCKQAFRVLHCVPIYFTRNAHKDQWPNKPAIKPNQHPFQKK